MLIDIYMKLCGDSLNHFQVTEWTRFCDRRPRKGGDINIRILAQAGGGILLLVQILSALASPSKGVCVGRGGGYLEQNKFKNRHNWHARSNGEKKSKRTMMVLYRSPEQTALHTYC